MDGAIIGALIGVGAALVVNIAASFFWAGKISTKVETNKSIVSAQFTVVEHEIKNVGKNLDRHITYTENNGKEVIRLCNRADRLEDRVDQLEKANRG